MKTDARHLICILVVLLVMVHLSAEPASTNSPALAAKPAPATTPDGEKIKEAVRQMQGRQFDAAMNSLNDAVRINPQNQVPYFLRASISASRNLWPAAEKDLLVAESITPNDVDIEMFLGDVFLMQKKYTDARRRFASLAHDENRGDLATYKIFVCDALGDRSEEAAKELALFDQSPAKPSCYYAHATRALIDDKADDGRRWLDSAAVLFAPVITAPYIQCLRSVGYLPTPKANP